MNICRRKFNCEIIEYLQITNLEDVSYIKEFSDNILGVFTHPWGLEIITSEDSQMAAMKGEFLIKLNGNIRVIRTQEMDNHYEILTY